MDSVKYLFGTVMIGMAFYYVHPIYPAWLFQALLGLAVLGLAVMFGRVRKVYALPVLAIGIATMVFIAKMPGKNAEGSFPKLAWQTYSDQAREEALKKGQPILIDFTADWCGACKELEKYTFTDPRVREISEKFALLRFDATEESPALDALRERYKILGLPTLVFYDGKGKLRTELTVTGFEKADIFLEKMAKAAQSDTQSTAASQ
jgi:thiol:disulfide interchange protein DsbD